MNTTAKTILIIAPWVAVIVLAVVANGLHEQNETLNTEQESIQAKVRHLEKAADAASADELVTAQEFQDQQDDSRDAWIEELEASLADLQALYDDTVAENAPSDDDGESEKSPMAGIYANFTEEMAQTTATTQVSLFYGDFLSELNVDAATREEIRAIINDFKGAEMFDHILVARGELTQAEVKALDYSGQLRDALSTVLPPEELAYYDEYEDGMPERMIRQSYDLQLSMFAGEMTEENREFALDLMVDEMLTRQENREASPNSDQDPTAEIESIIEMFDSISLQLSEMLPEDQYAAFERFAEQQVNNMRIAQQMFKQQQDANER